MTAPASAGAEITNVGAAWALGCHVKTGTLCRVPARRTGLPLPDGCLRVLKYRDRGHSRRGRLKADTWHVPYDMHGHLKPAYWSLPRGIELGAGARRQGVR